MQRVIHGSMNEGNLAKLLEGMNKFYDMFLFSILHDDHYFMVAFNRIKNTITYYKSMGSTGNASRKYE